MFTLQQVRSPAYVSADGEQIFMYVKWAEFDEEHPFSATSFDVMEHGRDLHLRAKAGEFGPVAPYVPPPITAENQPSTQGSQNL